MRNTCKILFDEKNSSRLLIDQNTGKTPFWFRGDDLEIEAALINADGTHVLASDLAPNGTIEFVVRANNENESAPKRMSKAFTSADLDANFIAEDWEGGSGSLVTAAWTLDEAALEVPFGKSHQSYIIYALVTSPEGKLTTYGSGIIEVRRAPHTADFLNPPAPLTSPASGSGPSLIGDVVGLGDALAAKSDTGHTHNHSDISDFNEAVQDAVGALLSAGSNVTLNYDDANDSLSISATGGGGSADPEEIRDVIGVALASAGLINVSINDAADTITISTTATQNSTDAQLRDRSSHTGTQTAATISDFTTAVQTLIDASGGGGGGALDFTQAENVILGGQSNAPGRGTELSVEVDKTPQPWRRIWSHETDQFETWDLNTVAQMPPALNGGGGPVAGAYNMAWSYAEQRYKETGRPVNVFIMGEGGQQIEAFIPETSNHWSKLKTQVEGSGIPHLHAFIWMQGEAHVAANRQLATYPPLLRTIRSQAMALTKWSTSTVFNVCEISEAWIADGNRNNLNVTLRTTVAEINDPFTRIVPTGKLPSIDGDLVHLSGPGQVAAGVLVHQVMQGGLQHVLPDDVVPDVVQPPVNPNDDFDYTPYIVAFDLDARDATSDGGNSLTSWPERIASLEPNSIASGITSFNNGVSMNGANALIFPTGLNITGNYSIYAVATFKTSSAGNNQIVVDGSGSNRILIFSHSSDLIRVTHSNSLNTAVAPDFDQKMSLCFTNEGSASKIYIDGVEAETGGSSTSGFGGDVKVGSTGTGSPSNIEIHKILVVQNTLTPAQIAAMDAGIRDAL